MYIYIVEQHVYLYAVASQGGMHCSCIRGCIMGRTLLT